MLNVTSTYMKDVNRLKLVPLTSMSMNAIFPIGQFELL